MDWIYTKEKTPICFRKDEEGLMNSDIILIEDENNCKYLAYFCEGVIDDCKIADWYTDDGWHIDKEIVRWLPIPE